MQTLAQILRKYRLLCLFLIQGLIHCIFLFIPFVLKKNDAPLKKSVQSIATKKIVSIHLKQQDILKKQIIQLDKKNITEEKMIKTKYLSAEDNMAKKEMQAKMAGKFQNNSLGISDLAFVLEKQQKYTKKIHEKKLTKAKDGHTIHKKMIKDEESVEALDKFSPSSLMAMSSDYLEDIPPGKTTDLNTSKFKFYGFYNRIREKLELYWGQSLKEKTFELYQKGKAFQSSEDYLTSLVIHLDNTGKIRHIVLKGASGSAHLDQAAIEAFNQAGPFPNPPKEMIVNGTVEIEWGFVVKT